jgi:hypothetical protein
VLLYKESAESPKVLGGKLPHTNAVSENKSKKSESRARR